MNLAERRSRFEAAHEALADLRSVLHQATGPELADLMTLTDAMAAQAAAARVEITVEAVTRGEVADSGCNTHAWVRDHAPSLRQGGAGDVAKIADAVTPAASQWRPEGGEVDPESPLGIVWAAVSQGSVSPAMATATLREFERLAPSLREDAKSTVLGLLLDLGREWGPGMMRRLRPRLVGEYGNPGALDDLQERLTPAARLSSPFVESGDLTEYQLLMTPEQAAALEAAIGPLSAPAPNDETGERDHRPAGQRRVEALTEVCRRSSAADADEHGGADGAAGSASAVHVIIPLSDLESRTGCGEVLGSTATGTVLSPESLRRISCEADLIPHVLGTAGEDLDLGRVVRLFTRAQRRRLLRRDRCCTYPGCTAPGGLGQGAPRHPLDRRRAVRHRQRRPLVRAAPRVRARASPDRDSAEHTRPPGAGTSSGTSLPAATTDISNGCERKLAGRPATSHVGTTTEPARRHSRV